MQLLFSYGSLQVEKAQLAVFGRRLTGVADSLPGYRMTRVPIADPQRAEVHAATHYANIVPGTMSEQVAGTLLEVRDEELALVDGYERLDGYARTEVSMASGKRAWVYVFQRS
jgi:gamma-glutamylcyclotransferase (GGCT)/AIG2-like uncharacterized protein YtfP